MNKYLLCLLLILLPAVSNSYRLVAQTIAPDPIERNWYNDKKSAKIQIYKESDGKYYGKIVWLKIPDQDGKPKVDGHNSDKAHKNDPILGLVILKKFDKKGKISYENGTIYDPNNGKTYSCILTYKDDHLDVRGYIGISFIGRTTKFYPAD